MGYNVVTTFIAENTKFLRPVGQIVDLTVEADRVIRRAGQASLALGGAMLTSYGLASKGTLEFDRNLRNTNSLIMLSNRQYKELSDSLLDLATEVPRSASSLAAGAYNIASSGFTAVNDIEELLEQSSKAATAGLTDTDIAAKAIVTTLNAYNLTADQSERVSDVLFQTVNRGQLTFEDLALNLGDFIGVARAGNATLEETFAAYANITIATGQAHRAATSVQAIFRSLLNPTDELTAVTRELGYETTRTAVQEKGLEGFLRELSVAVGGNSEALFDLFGNVEAVTGVLALQAFNTDRSAENLSYFTEQAKIAGVTERTFAEQSRAVSAGLDRARAAAGAMGIEFGSTVVPVLDAAGKTVLVMVRIWRELPEPIREVVRIAGLASGVLLAVAGVTALLFVKFKLLRLAIFFITKVGLIGWLRNYVLQTQLGSMATSVLTTRVALLRTQLGAAALSLGKAATGIGLFALASEQLSEALHPTKIRESRKALDELAASGVFTGRLKEAFGDIEGLANKIDEIYDLSRTTVVTGMLNPWNKTDPFKVSRHAKAIDDLDEALVQLVQEGNGERAAQIFSNLSDQLKENGNNVDQINEAFNDYRGAAEDADLASKGVAQSQVQAAIAGTTLEESLYRDIDVATAAERAFKNLTEAQQEFAAALAEPAGSLESVFGAIVERRRASQEDSRRAGRGRSIIEQANDIAQATLGIVRAQHRLNDAEREYGRLAREGNAEAVSEAEDRLVNARRSLEAATVRLTDAELALDELRRGPTARDLRELEIDLERARDRQAEAATQLTYAENKLAAAQDHGTPEELAESERELREARRQLEEAAWAVTDAEEALGQARRGPDSKGIVDAEREVAEARRDVQEATKEAGEAEEELATVRAGEEYATALRNAELDLREAVLGVESAHLALAKAQEEEGAQAQERFREEQERTRISLGETMTELETQIGAYERWSDNILKIAEKFGPAVATILAKMGMDGAQVVDELANATGADAERMANDLEKWAILGSEAFNNAVVQNLGAAKENARSLTKDQVAAVAEELSVGYGKAVELLEQYVGEVEKTAKAEIREVGAGRFRLYVPGKGFVGAAFEEEGGMFYGGPGTGERHVAQIAPAGSWRVWAEPETGGEAYIPLAASKRQRSLAILAEVADMFGLSLQRFAQGGMAPPLPVPPSFQELVGQGAHSIMAFKASKAAQRAYDEALFARMMGFPPPKGPIGNVADAGRYFRSLGYLVGEHPLFGGVSAGHVENSYHYRGRAVDVNWAPAGQEPARLDALAAWIAQNLGYAELLWRTSGHFNHLHLAMSRGGIVSFDNGGYLQPGYTLAYNGTGIPEPVGASGGETYMFDIDITTHMTADADASKVTAAVGAEVGRQLREFKKGIEGRVLARSGRRR